MSFEGQYASNEIADIELTADSFTALLVIVFLYFAALAPAEYHLEEIVDIGADIVEKIESSFDGCSIFISKYFIAQREFVASFSIGGHDEEDTEYDSKQSSDVRDDIVEFSKISFEGVLMR